MRYGRCRLAALSSLLLIAACGSSQPADPWIVTQTHAYPAHSRTTFTGQCPPGLTDVQPLPTNCTRSQVDYPYLMEVCAKRRSQETCWYIPKQYDYVYFEQRPGRVVQEYENYIFTNPHLRPTNEWDQSG